MKNRTTLSPSPIDAYMRGVPAKHRVAMDKMRQTIKSLAPKASETISYGIPTFDLNGKHLVHFAALKTHLGFFPTSGPITVFKKELEPYSTSKGTIRFPWGKPLPMALIKKIVRFRIAAVTSSNLSVNTGKKLKTRQCLASGFKKMDK